MPTSAFIHNKNKADQMILGHTIMEKFHVKR